jgi:hypothetical protein
VWQCRYFDSIGWSTINVPHYIYRERELNSKDETCFFEENTFYSITERIFRFLVRINIQIVHFPDRFNSRGNMIFLTFSFWFYKRITSNTPFNPRNWCLAWKNWRLQPDPSERSMVEGYIRLCLMKVMKKFKKSFSPHWLIRNFSYWEMYVLIHLLIFARSVDSMPVIPLYNQAPGYINSIKKNICCWLSFLC